MEEVIRIIGTKTQFLRQDESIFTYSHCPNRIGTILPVANRRFHRLFCGDNLTPMNPAPEMNIEYVANLARLALTEAEKSKFAQQLAEILHYVEKLKQVDVTGVEPMAHASPVFNVWAEDSPAAGLPVEKALQNAPAQRDHLIVMPKVIE